MPDLKEFENRLDSLVPLVLEQLKFTRDYLTAMITDVPDEEWFRMPEGLPTHLAWQIGHLAMAEYGLCLFRVRGRVPEDAQLMPSPFRKAFARGSTVVADPSKYPSPAEIRDTLSRVRAQVELEAPSYTHEMLVGEIEMPYSIFPNKMGGMLFSPQHEMIHAGQIGLWRRALGRPPLR